MSTPESDRGELAQRLHKAVTEYHKWRFVVVPSVKREMIDTAFEAMADCGVFNRLHPDMRIEPVPE